MMKNPYAVYKKVKQETTTPQEAVLLAYNGILSYLEKAKSYMQEKNYELTNETIFKARRLLSELTLGLNDDCAELSDKFRAIYNYCYNLTILANLRKDPAVLDEVISLIKPLRDAWQEMKEKIKDEIKSEENSDSIAVAGK